MTEANVRLALNDYFDAAALSSSSAATALPVTNLQDQQRTKVWRATGCASEYVDVHFADDFAVSLIALISHNMSSAAQINIKAGAAQGGSELLDATYDGWEAPFTWGGFVWGDSRCSWDGMLLDDELLERPIRRIYISGGPMAPWWRVTIIDPTNSDGYVQVGRMFISSYYQPSFNASWPYSFTPVDDSIVTKSLGGQKWTDFRSQHYQLGLNFEYVKPGEVWWSMADFLRRVGTRRDFFIDVFPESIDQGRRAFTVLYGRLTEVPELVVYYPHYGSFSMTVEESL